MLGSIAQDSKGRERYIKVLAGMIKPSGTIHALIENDKGEKYRITRYPSGASMCRHEVNGKHEPCPSRGRCYHVQAVRMVSALFTEDGIMTREQAPRELQYYYHEDVEVAAEAGDKSYGEALDNAYEQLGATKRVSIADEIMCNLASRGLLRGQRQNSCGGQRIA